MDAEQQHAAFQSWLAEMRQAGWSQSRIARELGVTPQYISDIKQKKRGVTEQMARRLEDAYALPIGTFGFSHCGWYRSLLPAIRTAARLLGYAVGVHGSEARDLDLIAVPWVEAAAPAEQLVEIIAGATGGFVDNGYTRAGEKGETPARKPHGRRAWAIHLGRGRYIDLSVMPRAASSQGG